MDIENTQNNRDVKKSVLTTVVAGIIVLSVLILWTRQTKAPQQAQTSPTPDPEVASINQEIETLNAVNLNAELEAIDNELEGL
ncbi:MAG TPA: hypothetical protein VJC06_01555 [Candidatus Paceibacterota bacterium]